MALEQQRLLTYADYVALPEDGKRYELIDGEFFVTPAPSYWHQKLADRIIQAIRNYLDEHPVGDAVSAPFDVVLNPQETRAWQPDVLYVANEHRDIIQEKRILGAPDLVVEVVSPGSEQYDLGAKKDAYEQAGVREYWVVWQSFRRVEVYRLKKSGRYGKPDLLDDGDTLTTDLLPGFSLPVARLYAGQ